MPSLTGLRGDAFAVFGTPRIGASAKKWMTPWMPPPGRLQLVSSVPPPRSSVTTRIFPSGVVSAPCDRKMLFGESGAPGGSKRFSMIASVGKPLSPESSARLTSMMNVEFRQAQYIVLPSREKNWSCGRKQNWSRSAGSPGDPVALVSQPSTTVLPSGPVRVAGWPLGARATTHLNVAPCGQCELNVPGSGMFVASMMRYLIGGLFSKVAFERLVRSTLSIARDPGLEIASQRPDGWIVAVCDPPGPFGTHEMCCGEKRAVER